MLAQLHELFPVAHSKSTLRNNTAVSILCTSCKTKFWVIQQNRKYLLEFYFRLGKPTDYNFRLGKLPEYYIRTDI